MNTLPPTATPPVPAGLWGRFWAFRERHHVPLDVAAFFAGFLFDFLLLRRIDSTPLLIHQGTYLVLLTGLLAVDHRYFVAGADPEGLWGKVLSFRHWVIHFFLGTLLNAFLIFYFKASSGVFSFLFIVALAAVLIINELPRFRSLGPVLRVALLSFSITSYLAYLLPVLWGSLQSWHFALAVVVASGVTLGLWRLFRRFTRDPDWTFRRAAGPGLAIQAALLLLYLARVIPPVPLNLQYIGIFHQVERVKEGDHAGQYRLDRVDAPSALSRFFALSTDFLARPEDKAYAFITLFAPSGFSDRIGFAWDYDDPKQGWVELGEPFYTGLTGGREQGFRTYANRTVARTGTYRVRVVTLDGREIGRKTFEVIADPSTEERSFRESYK